MVSKKISPRGKSVRITFSVPAESAETSLAVVGDFNEWNAKKGLMKLKKKAGVWTKGVSVKPGESLEFRYLADGAQWLDEAEADAHVPNEFFGTNCVVTTEAA